MVTGSEWDPIPSFDRAFRPPELFANPVRVSQAPWKRGGMPWLSEIPYIPESSHLFEAIAARPWAMFLDSGQPTATGRWDILTADPFITLVTRNGITEIRDAAGLSVSSADPFSLLRHYLGAPVDSLQGIPFAGGAVGWFAYDLARRIERLPVQAADWEQLPELAVGIFDWAVLVDHATRHAWLVGQGRDPHTRERWPQLLRFWRQPTNTPLRRPFRVLATPRPNLTIAQYKAAFHRIQRAIRAGDCYQINFAQRFAAPAEGDPWTAYQALRHLNPAPFSAYLTTPYGQVLSSSPERFLQVRGGQVETRPIKGTRPRGATPAADAVLAQDLLASPKEQAENLMIVDLLRNDLGRVCIPGSIQVPQLFELERYATVQHLVSTVTGRLAPGQDAVSLLRACFPGGSITGAPKIRAMQIIEELEPQRRGIYCGALGYLGFDGAMDTNIAIRTLVYSNATIRCWAGGGILYDSEPDQEYRETIHKAAALLRVLQAFRGTSGERGWGWSAPARYGLAGRGKR